MPVEIHELHIKVEIADDAREERSDPKSSKKQSDALIEACVEQVMEILRRKEQR